MLNTPIFQEKPNIYIFYLKHTQKFWWPIQKIRIQGFTGGPVAKNLPSNAADWGLIPGWGTKIPHAKGSIACTLWQEKACVSQWRPSTFKHKNKYINKTETPLFKKKKNYKNSTRVITLEKKQHTVRTICGLEAVSLRLSDKLISKVFSLLK